MSEPVFVILSDATPGGELWQAQAAWGAGLPETCAPVLGFEPEIRLVPLPRNPGDPVDGLDVGERDLFLLPAMAEFSLYQKQCLAELAATARRSGGTVYHDDVDAAHPLLLDAYVNACANAMAQAESTPANTGLLLIANGDGDANSRAESYRLMRLIWEQLGLAAGDVAFLRHERTPLPEKLADCASRGPGRCWICLPVFPGEGEQVGFARTILADFAKRTGIDWPLADAIPGEAVAACLRLRLLKLWNSHRAKHQHREPSPKYRPSTRESKLHGPYGAGWIAEIAKPGDLEAAVAKVGLSEGPFFVKVTWHGYATGTYTDAVVLDKLLTALPGKAIILEGHSSGRNTGGADFDWEQDSRENRVWIREQEADFLARTGLREVLDRHGADYLNVSEAWWDGQCAPASDVAARLTDCGVRIQHDELLGFVPSVILEHAGAPFISFARFKGPTRLGISNCFGLIPAPLRTAWHGPHIGAFAGVCCDMAKIYGALLRPIGMVEALNVAVRWRRRGMYRSRWGNYDLIRDPGVITFSEGLVGADILASRLQGQDVRKSAFFAVVNRELGFDSSADSVLPSGLITRFA
ncbi:MAG: hypothetical protein ACI8W8_000234 [Rhodothermales bacterium]|jgi:hypothetical protein